MKAAEWINQNRRVYPVMGFSYWVETIHELSLYPVTKETIHELSLPDREIRVQSRRVIRHPKITPEAYR